MQMSPGVFTVMLCLMQCVTCNCYKVEKVVLDAGSNKKLILVLNKIGELEILCAESVHCIIDLVPKEVVERWLKHLRNEFPTVAFKSSTQSQSQHLVSFHLQ